MDKSELLKLAERVETLSGRSRVANARIWKACKPDEYDEWEYSSRVMLPKGLSEDHKKNEMNERAKVAAPNFTGSLDAAMTLVERPAWVRIDEWPDEFNATSASVQPIRDPQVGSHCAKAATPALALCAASLRALAKEDS